MRIELAGVTIVDSTAALRVLETSHPPTIYVPPADIAPGSSSRAPGGPSANGRASPPTSTSSPAIAARRAPPGPTAIRSPAYAALRDHVAFYPSRMDACWLDDELVQAQAGDFYGGWITAELRGPFKGAPGTRGW